MVGISSSIFQEFYSTDLFLRTWWNFFNKAEHEAGDLEFNYENISDEEAEEDFRPNTVEDKGFFYFAKPIIFEEC